LTRVPSPAICLLSFIVSKAIVDNAFVAGFTEPEQVLDHLSLEPGVPYTRLSWKPKMMDKAIFNIPYDKLLSLWKLTMLVAGVRDPPRPYSMRVGTGQRLDGKQTQEREM